MFIVSVIIYKVGLTVASMQFLRQMLLLDDVLLKCAVTEVILFSIVAIKTLTFYKVV